MSRTLFRPVSPDTANLVRPKCAFESYSAAYDYSCFRGFTNCKVEEIEVRDFEAFLVLDRRGYPYRLEYFGESIVVKGSFGDWLVCENGRLIFRKQGGEFFELPEDAFGKKDTVVGILDKGDEYQFSNFMYAYLHIMKKAGVAEIAVPTFESSFD